MRRAHREEAAVELSVRDGVAYGGPYHVEIYPADRCNIDCFFCSTAALRGTDEVPLTRLEEMIAEDLIVIHDVSLMKSLYSTNPSTSDLAPCTATR